MAAGEGTERSEDFLKQRFPEYPIVRVDRDSTRKKGALEEFVATADSGEPCVLVGTQILAKGTILKTSLWWLFWMLTAGL